MASRTSENFGRGPHQPDASPECRFDGEQPSAVGRVGQTQFLRGNRPQRGEKPTVAIVLSSSSGCGGREEADPGRGGGDGSPAAHLKVGACVEIKSVPGAPSGAVDGVKVAATIRPVAP